MAGLCHYADAYGVLASKTEFVLGPEQRGLGRIDWLNILVRQVLQLFTDGVLHSSLFGNVMRHASALSAPCQPGGRLLGP
jgi:hypothetical protein